MNPVLDAIYKRRSIRDFTADPIERDTLIEIIRAGTWAPLAAWPRRAFTRPRTLPVVRVAHYL